MIRTTLGNHRYIIFSRDEMASDAFAQARGTLDYVVISVNEIGGELCKLPEREACKAVLRLAFSDVLMRTGNHVPLDYADARKIVDFVDEWQGKVDAFVIHCHAGISRSPAIAAAIAAKLGHCPKVFWEKANPNGQVFSMILAADAMKNAGEDLLLPDIGGMGL